MDEIEVHFTYTEADYQEFLRNYFWKNQSKFYILLLVFMLAFLVFTFKGAYLSWNFFLSCILPIALFAGLWLAILRHSGRRAFRMNDQMQETRSGRIDRDKISIAGQTFSSDFLWEGVQRVEETRNLYLVYNSKASAVMLPKRVFTANQQQHFKKIVAEKPGLAVHWLTS